MEKNVLAVLLLFLVVGTALGQTTPDSSQIQENTRLSPRLKFKKEPNRTSFEFKTPRKNESKLFRKAPHTKQKTAEEATPFYSNMPLAKLQGRKRDTMPSAQADSSRHYHLLNKRFKVLPVPTEEDFKEGEEKGVEPIK